MTELWLVRHGATDWNLQGRYQGQIDVPLNPTGLEQAQALAQKLAGKKFAAIYCSHLERARQTAQALADRLNLAVKIDPRLQEVSLGDWEGELFDDIAQNYPEHIAERRSNPVHSRPPGGESVAEVAARMAQAADDIARAHPEGPVIIVSHGLALATLICLARQIPLNQAFKLIPENAAPEVIEWPSPPQAAQPGQFSTFGIDRNN